MLARNTILQGRYRIIRPLGRGGMGQVYEAIDDTVDSIVVIKETFAGTDKLRAAFAREAKLLANLKHPALPRVTHYFQEGQGQFLVMEFIEGLNLAELLKIRKRPFRYEEVVPWADRLLDALAYLHGRPEPVIHRDIKPANIKLTDEEGIYLLDFGLAKGAPGLETSSVHGYTAAYAPLEQLTNSGSSPQSDLYSLGATLYHLLAGRLPALASERYETLEEEGRDPLAPLNQVNPEVPVALSAIINRALAMKRRDRFASAAEMREALREAAPVMEREREEAILNTPTLPLENVYAIPAPTEPAPDLVGQPGVGRAGEGLEVLREDAYLKTITATPPAVPPPPEEFSQPSWPSQIDSEPAPAVLEGEEEKEREPADDGEGSAPARREVEAEPAEETKPPEESELQKQRGAEEIHGLEVEEGERLRAAREGAKRERAAGEIIQGDARPAAEDAGALVERALARLPVRKEPSQDELRRRRRVRTRIALLAGIALIVTAAVVVILAVFSPRNDEAPAGDSGQAAATAPANPSAAAAPAPAPLAFKQDVGGQRGVAWSVAFSPDGSIAASASGDGKVRFWDARSWKLIYSHEGHAAGVNSVAFSPDNKFVASAGNDRKIFLNPREGIKPAAAIGSGTVLSGHTDEVYFVAFSPDSHMLASAGKDRTVRLWSLPDGKELKTLSGHTDVVWSVAFSLDGKTLASAGKDGTIKLWDTDSGKEVRTLPGHTGPVISIAFSPDGKLLASGGNDKTVRLWDARTWQELKILSGHTEYVTSVAFSPDGRTLASAGDDRTVRLWDAQTGQLRQTLTGHTKGVTSVSFSPDGGVLISGGKDETVKVWQ